MMGIMECKEEIIDFYSVEYLKDNEAVIQGIETNYEWQKTPFSVPAKDFYAGIFSGVQVIGVFQKINDDYVWLYAWFLPAFACDFRYHYPIEITEIIFPKRYQSKTNDG